MQISPDQFYSFSLSSSLGVQGSVTVLGVFGKYKKLKQIDFSRFLSQLWGPLLGVQGSRGTVTL